MSTISLKSSRIRDITSLNIQGINTGFISSLGSDFAAALHETIAHSISSFEKCGFEFVRQVDNHGVASDFCEARADEILADDRKTKDVAEVRKVSQCSEKSYSFEPKPGAGVT